MPAACCAWWARDQLRSTDSSTTPSYMRNCSLRREVITALLARHQPT
ncbi:hypothetical protein RAJCM14343_1142 [Rhodococcus aetherivorans]|uniref:Uncharacterized protein n=1 Tax=Rhodococcus aetherivorans TaxID=191292 RepID=A0ABQ0YHA1_9NOCA|nr:hypothetical protein RAJCM14343_1142 [Rhodococcus aetherivorans]